MSDLFGTLSPFSMVIYSYTIFTIGSEKVFPPIAMVNKTSFVTISLLPIDF